MTANPERGIVRRVTAVPTDSYLRRAREEIDRTIGPLDTPTIARPCSRRWSIAEILEHLTLAFRNNATTLEKALASGEVRGRRPRPAAALGRILVVDIGYFPRATAPERTTPTGSIPAEQSMAAILDALTTLDAALTRAASRFGETVLVANHPYFEGLTVPQWRKFHWRHTAHHMKQVRRIANP